MSEKGPLAAVLLDVGGTLIESRPSPPEVYAQVLSRWGPEVSPDAVAPVFAATWSELTQSQPFGGDRYHLVKGGEWAWWGGFLRRVLTELHHPAPWEPVLEELFAAFADPTIWHVFAEVRGVLAALQEKGLRLAAVSNWDSRLPGLLEQLDLRRYFDQLVVSSLEGVEKPAPEIFLRAAARLGVAPAQCLHVGDSPLDDYRGATGVGMEAVLIDRAGMFANGYRRIADLRGLDALLA